MMRVNGVSRAFNEIRAVENVDLELQDGHIYGLIGPNGAGKTTLMLMLAGLLAPDTGEIKIDGMGVDSPQARGRIGWMPDNFGTWDALKVGEILQYFAQFYGHSKLESKTLASEALAKVGLEGFENRAARVLSRGQRQLLGLARALINRPSLLLLDEPAGNLDPSNRIKLRNHLRELCVSGVSVLISSHILPELEDIIDTPIFMRAGRIVAPENPNIHQWHLSLQNVAPSYSPKLPSPGEEKEGVEKSCGHPEVSRVALEKILQEAEVDFRWEQPFKPGEKREQTLIISSPKSEDIGKITAKFGAAGAEIIALSQGGKLETQYLNLEGN